MKVDKLEMKVALNCGCVLEYGLSLDNSDTPLEQGVDILKYWVSKRLDHHVCKSHNPQDIYE
jgi:hypothetical protein